MKWNHLASAFGAVVLTVVLAKVGAAAPIYENNFEGDTTANWTVNNGPSINSADFFFDYSTSVFLLRLQERAREASNSKRT